MGGLNLLEQRHMEDIDLIRWSLPTTTRQRALVSRELQKDFARSQERPATQGSPANNTGPPPPSLQSEPLAGEEKLPTKGGRDSSLVVVEDDEDERAFFGNLQRRLCLQFAAQQNRQAKLLERRGVLIDLGAKTPEKETGARKQFRKRRKRHEGGGESCGYGRACVSSARPSIRVDGEEQGEEEGPSCGPGEDGQQAVACHEEGRKDAHVRERDGDGADGKGEEGLLVEKGSPRTSTERAQLQNEDEEDVSEGDPNPRILSLQR